jgi:anti-sigma regulatory factor (Ser/Thr protein kinase)
VCCDALLREHPPFETTPGATPAHVDLDPVPSSVGIARSFVRERLAEVDEDPREVALLLASELVTNAILHARTPVQLGVLHDAGHVLVCVADRRDDTPDLQPQDKSGDRPGGRGLALVDDLASRWGTERFTGGKTVWFVLPSSDEELKVG